MDLLTKKIKPLYFHLLSAAVGSSFITCIFAMVDAMVVGQYHGPDGTSSLAIFMPVWTVVYGFGFITGVGGSVLFSNARGKGDPRSSNEYFTLALLYTTVLSILSLLVFHFFNDPLFRFFGASDALLPLAKRYLRGVEIALPFCIFSNFLAAFLRNDGSAGLSTASVLVGGIFNLFGDFFFVFSCDMGILGAGIATAGSLILSALMMLTHFFRKRNTLRLVLPTNVFHKLVKITVVGFPSALSDISMGVIAILFNRQIMKYLNSDALAVYGVIVQLTAFVQCCAYSAGQAAQPIISTNLGAGQHRRIGECLRLGIYTSAFFGALWALLAATIPNAFVRFFMTPTPSVLEIAPNILGVYGISYLLLVFNVFSTYYFQAVMKPMLATAVSLGRGVVLSGIFVLILPAIWGGESIWFAMILTELVIAIFGGYKIARIEKLHARS